MPWQIAVVVAVLSFGSGWVINGWRGDLEVSHLKQAINDERMAADSEARRKEREYRVIAASTMAQHAKEMSDAQARFNERIVALGTGASRVSIAARCPTRVSTVPDTAGVVAETRAELDPTAAVALETITYDGDVGIKQLNELIMLVNAAQVR